MDTHYKKGRTGEKIGEPWWENERIGYSGAFGKTISIEIASLLWIPGRVSLIIDAGFQYSEIKRPERKYRVRYTELQRYQVVYDAYLKCYNKCTNEEVCCEKHGESRILGEIVIGANRAYEVDRYVGDERNYNKRWVRPQIIEE